MNDSLPGRDGPDDMDERYRRASLLDSSRPSAAVRRAILEQAASLAADREGADGGAADGVGEDHRAADRGARRVAAAVDFHRPAANRSRWRLAVAGTAAAAALVGFLVLPRVITKPATDAPAMRAPATGAAVPSAPVEDSAASLETRRSRETAGALAAQSAARQMAAPPAVAAHDAAAGGREPGWALRRAAERGDMTTLQEILRARTDVDARGADGRTALMLATLHGRRQAVEALLASGADPNAADAGGVTPLQAAVRADQSAIAEALRRAGAR